MFGLFVYINVAGIIATYPNPQTRQEVARTLGTNPGLHAFYGQPVKVDTISGYVSWRTSTGFVLFGGIWAILTVTRLLRGEEDAGRWELLLSGRTTRRRAAAGAATGLGGSLVVLYIGTAVLSVVSGLAVTGAWSAVSGFYLALAAMGGASLGMVLAMIASQLLPNRRAAIALASAALGAMFLARAVADTIDSVSWLKWATPLGWVEQLHPLVGGQPAAIIPWAGIVLLLAGLAVFLAGRRDIDSGFIPSHDTAPPHTRLLGGLLGLNIRSSRLTLVGWMLGTAVWSAIFGVLAKTAAEVVSQSSAFSSFLGNLGARSRAVEGFIGFTFFFIVILLAVYAASQAIATREEEARGYLDNLLVRPLGRGRWLAGRLAVSTAGLVALGLTAALAAWIAASAEGAGVGFVKMLAAGLNPVAPALFILGLGTLAHGVMPRSVAYVTFGVISWSFLVEMLGSVINSRFIIDLSVFHYVALAPAVDVDWKNTAIFIVLGLGAAILGGAGFRRRDLAGE